MTTVPPHCQIGRHASPNPHSCCGFQTFVYLGKHILLLANGQFNQLSNPTCADYYFTVANLYALYYCIYACIYLVYIGFWVWGYWPSEVRGEAAGMGGEGFFIELSAYMGSLCRLIVAWHTLRKHWHSLVTNGPLRYEAVLHSCGTSPLGGWGGTDLWQSRSHGDFIVLLTRTSGHHSTMSCYPTQDIILTLSKSVLALP